MEKRYSLTQAVQTPAKKIAYEEALNEEQFRVVTAGGGPTLVLAGPGSGKTRTLTYRVSYLIQKEIQPRNILLVTFTVKAAREMLDRVEKILGYRPDGLWGGTFHHIGNMILRQHPKSMGRTSAFGILDEEDAKDLITACMNDLKLSTTKTRFPQANVLESIFSLAVNTCRTLEDVVSDCYSQFTDLIPAIERIWAGYKERKRRANVLDYDDLLTELLSLLRNNPKAGQGYSKQFQYVLVDEYQDTNRLQLELIKEFSRVHGNILAVGDDAQSIYAFRGAEVKNLLEFPTIFPGTTIYRLETNYRSTPEILRLANASIQFNSKQFPKELHAVKGPGEIPALVPLADARQQAAFVAQRVLELREEGIPLQEIAVLFRARFQSAELELELAKRNIPYLVRGGVRFFEQAHIKDILAHLKILVNPQDEMAWQRTLQIQEGIGSGYARRIWEAIASASNPLQEAIRGRDVGALPSRTQAGWKRFINMFQELTNPAVSGQPVEAILAILRAGYEEYLKTHFKNASERREDLEQLMNLASHYESVERFVEDLALREPFKGETITGWEEPDEFLVLSTIHQAKGLEWSVVFLIGLVEGQMPHAKAIEDTNALEEERRLFYVAVTRTKSQLYLTYPLTRYTYQRGEVLMRPSSFIQELPEELYELWRVSSPDQTSSWNLDP
ncbi:MAG: ATP-dependent helicase [Candidatus Omnitrophica bacterium]|nr:ATP-dependent helicase [Candidatus Omnitrophota bacterium]